jgi:translation elongation factor EF-Tu-like GTPase
MAKYILEKSATSRITAESDYGNNEYKLKLFNSCQQNIDRITTQMRFRVEEGCGEAIYTIGVTDSGGIIGLTGEEYRQTKEILDIVVNKSNYSITLISEKVVETGCEKTLEKKIYEFLIRENNSTRYVDIRVACAGSVDAGKSTLLGVLLTGKNDDGRGCARLNVFNFQHEIKTGRTSSVAQHILGFDYKGQVVTVDDYSGHKKTWPEIIQESAKVVTFFDLCGHEKYLKTTITGLTSNFPDLTFILVGGNMNLSKMTKEHIFLCLSLHIPFVIIITKMDLCKERKNVLEETVRDVKSLLKGAGIRRIPYDVHNKEDVLLCSKNIHSLTTVPIFYISSVTGEGIDFLREFLNLHPKRHIAESVGDYNVEYHIDKTFQVSGIGTVLGGQLVKGKIRVGDKLLIGPLNNVYTTIQVRSIHCKRVNMSEVESCRYVCLGIKKPDDLMIRKGNVVISMNDNPIQVSEFEADITVLKTHSTTIKLGYQPVVHTCSIRQTAEIIKITKKMCGRGQKGDDDVLRTGDRATIRFKFCYKPEFIRRGFRILMAEGRVKLLGKIIDVFEENIKIV